jgi:ABC-2 type transport system permease protein
MKLSVVLRSIAVTTRKDIKIYYKKAPVWIFGLLLPVFLFLAFFIGRELNMQQYFPGFLAMSLFFTASSVGPLIIPWEKQAGTFERLLSYPVSLSTLVIGDILAGAIFGTVISLIVATVGVAFLAIEVTDAIMLFLFFAVGNLCFAALGTLLSAFSGRVPSNTMMLSALVRFPLIFISGVFIPLGQIHGAGAYLAYASPLTYLVDGFNSSLGVSSFVSTSIGVVALVLYSLLFFGLTIILLRRNLMKGL